MIYHFIKRFLDISISLVVLILSFPLIIFFLILTYLQDYNSPIFMAKRVGKNFKIFNMIKIRSMIINADKSGIDSTSSDDMRITNLGKIIRRYKIDELTQLVNVLIGDMSLVGPRPNVLRDVKLYSKEEEELLSILPGVTDFSSIIFSDEGSILENESDPDLAYNQIIRPWKSRLGLSYIRNKSIFLDIKIIFYTVIALISKKIAINWIVRKLIHFNDEKRLIEVCKRNNKLTPYPPPGQKNIVESRISE